MKTYKLMVMLLLASTFAVWGQQVSYEEFDLDNGLHVILHQDNFLLKNPILKLLTLLLISQP